MKLTSCPVACINIYFMNCWKTLAWKKMWTYHRRSSGVLSKGSWNLLGHRAKSATLKRSRKWCTWNHVQVVNTFVFCCSEVVTKQFLKVCAWIFSLYIHPLEQRWFVICDAFVALCRPTPTIYYMSHVSCIVTKVFGTSLLFGIIEAVHKGRGCDGRLKQETK